MPLISSFLDHYIKIKKFQTVFMFYNIELSRKNSRKLSSPIIDKFRLTFLWGICQVSDGNEIETQSPFTGCKIKGGM